MSIILAEDLTKWYGNIIGVNEVSFEIEGGIWGLVGPNGSGKTTLLNLISGVIKPSKGKIKIKGESPWKNYKIKRIIGYLPDIYELWEELTGREFLLSQAIIKNKKIDLKLFKHYLELFELERDIDRKISTYSKGMRQKLKFISTILHDPELIILDEPLNGVDPKIRSVMINLIKELGEKGKTVIISSHILSEIEAITSNIIFLFSGYIIAKGNIYKLRELLEDIPQRVIIRCSNPKLLSKLCIDYPDILGVEFKKNDTLIIKGRIKGEFLKELPIKAIESGIDIYSMTTPDYSLESLYKYLISG